MQMPDYDPQNPQLQAMQKLAGGQFGLHGGHISPQLKQFLMSQMANLNKRANVQSGHAQGNVPQYQMGYNALANDLGRAAHLNHNQVNKVFAALFGASPQLEQPRSTQPAMMPPPPSGYNVGAEAKITGFNPQFYPDAQSSGELMRRNPGASWMIPGASNP